MLQPLKMGHLKSIEIIYSHGRTQLPLTLSKITWYETAELGLLDNRCVELIVTLAELPFVKSLALLLSIS